MTRKDILIKALGQEIGSLAVKEILRQKQEEYLNQESYEKAVHVLSSSFRWDLSTQGREFWEKKQRELYSKMQ